MIAKRYLSREVIHTMLALIGIILLLVLSDMFVRFLSNAADGQFSSDLIVSFVGFALPQYLGLLIPIAFFLAIVITYGRMFSDNELLILFACGMSWRDMLKLLWVPTLIIVILVSALSFYLIPEMTAYQHNLQQTVGKKESISLIQPGRFISINGGSRVIYIGEMNENKEYQDIFAFDRNLSKQGPGILTAPTAYLQRGSEPGEEQIVLEHGHQYIGLPGNADFQVIDFGQYVTRLIPQQAPLLRDRINSMSTWQLLQKGGTPSNIELQWRLAMPIGVVVLLFLGLALCRVQPRQGRYAKLLPTILVFILYFNCASVMHAYMQNAQQITWYLNLWWVHIVFLAAACFWLWRADGYTWFRRREVAS